MELRPQFYVEPMYSVSSSIQYLADGRRIIRPD